MKTAIEFRKESASLRDEVVKTLLARREEVKELYVNKQFEGDIKVWKDSEMDGREYICINYEIIYLDTIKELY